MAVQDQIRIRYDPQRTYPGTTQDSYVGAQTTVGRRTVARVGWPIPFDTKTGSMRVNAANGNVLTIPNLEVGMTDRFLEARVNMDMTDDNPTMSVTGITWNGVALTLVDSHVHSSGGAFIQSRIELWKLEAPAVGIGDLVVTFTAQAPGFAEVMVAGTSWWNVNQATPLRTVVKNDSGAGGGASTSSTVTASGVQVYDTVIDVLGIYATNQPPWMVAGADQIAQNRDSYDAAPAVTGNCMGASAQPGTTGGVMTWDWAASGGGGHYVAMAVAIVGVDSGAQTFTTANTKFVSKRGDDSNTGTSLDPFLTIQPAMDLLAGAFLYACVLDSGRYGEEQINVDMNLNSGGLYAKDGQAPTLSVDRGANPTTLGARKVGRKKFSAGNYPDTFYFVSKAGNDGTGTRGDPALPFLTMQAAVNDGARVAADTLRIQDSGAYQEEVTIAAASGAITIEAADGQIPTMIPLAAPVNNEMIRAQDDTNVYGMTFIGNQWVIGDATTYGIQGIAAVMEIHDCTFVRGGLQVNASVPNVPATLDGVKTINCHFFRAGIVALRIFDLAAPVGVCTVTNCWFEETCYPKADPLQQSRSDILLRMSGTLQTIPSLRIDHMTSWDCRGHACVILDSLAGAGVGGGPTMIWHSEFKAPGPLHETKGVYAASNSWAGVVPDYFLRNVLFENLGGSAVHLDSNVPDANAPACLNITARKCCQLTTDPVIDIDSNQGGTWNDILILDAPNVAFSVDDAAGGQTIFTNCVSINAGTDAWYIAGDLTSIIQWNNCAEKGSVNNAINAPNAPAGYNRYSILDSPIVGIPYGEGSSQGDPLFLSIVVDNENMSYSASSPCIGAANDQATIGKRQPIVQLFASGANARTFQLDGFILDGDKYFHSGYSVPRRFTNRQVIAFCTFQNLGVDGVHASSAVEVKNCFFKTLGMGIVTTDFGNDIHHNVGWKCGGAFVMIGEVASDVRNNTAYGCEYGQFDSADSASITRKNNVFADNGTRDYGGVGEQSYSDVGTIDDDAIVTNGSRLHPLFRDVENEDLRIQAVALGFAFDSPAKGLGDDDKDAGAFDITYGSLSLTWTTVDFATGAGDPDTAYRNPVTYQRIVRPVKLTEGEKANGDFYSTAAAFVVEHVFEWTPNAAMPSAQVTALQAIYETGDGECQLSFDAGGSWIPVRVVRGQEFRYQEIQGLAYSDDSVHTPVNRLVFRESD